MELVQTFSTRQTMQMGGQMLHSLSILGMASEDLSDHLVERAEANPFLKYRPPAAFATRGGADDFDAVAAVAADRPSLMAHVVAQIELAFSSPADRLLALRFAEALEPTGWLGQTVETVALQAGVPVPRADRVLGVLQGLEPSGIFARNLAECLRIQAREADLLTWEVETLLANLDLVGEGRLRELAVLCDCDPKDIPDILSQLKGLDPKPGLAFDHVAVPVFPPDLIATRGEDGWTVELNRATTPTITVQEERGTAEDTAEARRANRKALSEARALALALERRGDTLLRTAAVLVAKQSAFLDGTSADLVPLTLEDVADELGLHASTVSRAVSGRMIQTATHALPLKAFFSRAVSAQAGAPAVSRDSALSFVEVTVRNEDKSQPLSDDAIVELAERAGLRIARRTVAKYRSTLGLGSSYQRRRAALAVG
jgi:RNA polymerase sigma-54 factor